MIEGHSHGCLKQKCVNLAIKLPGDMRNPNTAWRRFLSWHKHAESPRNISTADDVKNKHPLDQ